MRAFSFPVRALATILIALGIVNIVRADSRHARDLFLPSNLEAARIDRDTPIARARNVAFDVGAFEAPVDVLRCELFEDAIVEVALERRSATSAGDFTWTGTIASDPPGRASFAVCSGAVCGTLRIGHALYRVVSTGAETARIEEIDEARVPPCATTAANAIRAQPTSSPSAQWTTQPSAKQTTQPSAKQTTPPSAQQTIPPSAPLSTPASTAHATASSAQLAASPTIDVLVVYTPAARAAQGGTDAMRALVELAVLETNQAYAASNVTQRVRLVHCAELPNYAESGNFGTELIRAQDPNDGQFDYVHTWRTQCGADAVAVIENSNSSCGISFLMGTLDPNFGPNAFAVVSRTCATGFYTFGHELGHVMGLAHDRDNTTEKTTRISYSSNLVQGNAASYSPCISTFARYTAFVSVASNLVPGDTNNQPDVFVRDRDTNTTQRINVGPAGVEANGGLISAPSISQTGRYIAFDSLASNLIANDTNGVADVFVRDTQTNTTERVSGGLVQANGDSFAPAISEDGRYVAFVSTAMNLVAGASGTQIYVFDRSTLTTVLASQNTSAQAGSGVSSGPTLSTDGRFVAFTSTASDLVPNDTNSKSDVFVRDLVLGVTLRASVASGGIESNGGSPYAPSISTDGRFVVFSSDATNLVPGDTNGTWDVFVFDRVTSTTRRASVDANGIEGNGASGKMSRPSITSDGRYVAFTSRASNLVPNDTNNVDDVFVRDRQLLTTRRVSVTPSGQQKFSPSGSVDQFDPCSIASWQGESVVFVSSAVLEVLDTNGLQDAYVYRMSEPNSPGVDTYSYGYRTPDGLWRTIMAYAPGTRVQFFSNPNVTFAGQALGVADPDPYAAECWKTLNSTASTVAAWFAPVFAPFCFGDGSGTACPCGNASATSDNAGCMNSLALAGKLEAQGTASLTNDAVVLHATGMPNSSALYFQGTSMQAAGVGSVFGDGLRCVSGNVRRLGTLSNVANTSSLPSIGDLPLSVKGALTSPGSIHYQVWYRNAASFCSASTFNLTNGLTITWFP